MELETHDKNMNLELNGVKYRQKEHRIEVPDDVGKQFIKSSVPGLKKYTKVWSVGIDLKELERKKAEKNVR
jgi:hypothetical protein